MIALDLSTNQQYPNKKHKINMSSWVRNTISKLYNAVSGPVAATRDELTERLQSVRETASLLYNNGGEYGTWTEETERHRGKRSKGKRSQEATARKRRH